VTARILLLIPHPDDEIVACAASLLRARAAGALCFGLYLTTGVPPHDTLWIWQRPGYAARIARRRAEAEAAAARLGLVPAGFLDWPARTLKSAIGPALAAIDAALARHAITDIWAPAWEGGHQDHDVANFLAAHYAARCRVTEFAAYHFHGGRVACGRFPRPNGREVTLRLEPGERQAKRALLRLYRSERGNLAHIVTEQEQRRPLVLYDYAAPPHAGTLFRERFHWLPFRHPRIDAEPTAAVLACLMSAQQELAGLGEPSGNAVQDHDLAGETGQRIPDGKRGG
jgi:LmbE family N-acetylglucosaminyl deacetylase